MPDYVSPIAKSSLQSQQPKMEQRTDQPLSGVIENPPSEAAKLGKGIVLEAVITYSTNSSGVARAVISKAPIPEIINDEISLKTSAPLKEGARVTLQVTENRSGDLAIRVVQVESPTNVAKATAMGTTIKTGTASSIPQTAQELSATISSDPSVTISRPQAISATVIKGISQNITQQDVQTLGIAHTPLPNGTRFQITIQGIYPPSLPTESHTSLSTSSAIQNTAPMTTTNGAQIAEATSQQATASMSPTQPAIPQSIAIQQYSKSAQSVTPEYPRQEFNSPSIPLQTPLSTAPQSDQASTAYINNTDQTNIANSTLPSTPNVLSGIVEATNINGKTIVDTPAGKISITATLQVEIGSRIDIEVSEIELPASTKIPASAPLSAIVTPAGELNSGGWQAITDAQNLLRESNPILLNALTNAIPKAGPQLAANMLSFIRAAQTGGIEAWMGEAPLSALKNAGTLGKNIISRIDNTFKDISKKNSTSGVTKKQFTIPINANNEAISAITMIVMKQNPDNSLDQDESHNKNNGHGSRFLLNVSTTIFGEIQFDGLVFDKNRNLELIIKTKKPIIEQIKNEITHMFTQSLSALDYAGKITFQITQTFTPPELTETSETNLLDDFVI
ncbi:MAG: hypothetical protein GY804_08235 [Alphaproteobacteria bacterium]|nr:hypothetical protein [Alphaproteobacteria bacterium]